MSVEVASFTFHEVTDDVTSSGFQRDSALPYKHSTRGFTAHLDAIARAGRTPKRISDIDLQKSARHLVLTFDDGGSSALRAGEMLERRGWRGHFLVTTGKLGSRTFLDAAGVRALHDAGHVIGSHSHSHPNIFPDLSPAQMDEEWRVSCDRLSQIVGAPCRLASVPGGDLSRAALQSAHRNGLKWLFTSEPELEPRQVGDCWILGRICARRDTSSQDVQAWAEFRGWGRARIVRRSKVLLRTLLAPAYRAWVRAREPERQ
jgi:peptidoglycan/xylan/chitin deacetylase (PgdA/CDA1 family)